MKVEVVCLPIQIVNSQPLTPVVLFVVFLTLVKTEEVSHALVILKALSLAQVVMEAVFLAQVAMGVI